jgi:hypothetical protein
MRPPRDEDAPFIAALYSLDSPEPMPVERVLRELKTPTLDREHDARVTDTASVMLLRQGERAWLRLAGEVTPELLAWLEVRAREVGVTRLLAATWNVGGATAQLLESSGYSPKAFSLRMRIELEGRAFSPRFPAGIAVRTFREADAEHVYRTHLETFQDVSEPMRATFDEWSHSLLQPVLPPGPLVSRRGRGRARRNRALRPARDGGRRRPRRRARRTGTVARPRPRTGAARTRFRRVRGARLPRRHPRRRSRQPDRRRSTIRARWDAHDAPARSIREAARVSHPPAMFPDCLAHPRRGRPGQPFLTTLVARCCPVRQLLNYTRTTQALPGGTRS